MARRPRLLDAEAAALVTALEATKVALEAALVEVNHGIEAEQLAQTRKGLPLDGDDTFSAEVRAGINGVIGTINGLLEEFAA